MNPKYKLYSKINSRLGRFLKRILCCMWQMLIFLSLQNLLRFLSYFLLLLSYFPILSTRHLRRWHRNKIFMSRLSIRRFFDPRSPERQTHSHYLRDATDKQYINQHMHSMIHHLWSVSTPTCFGTEVPSSGSHLQQRYKSQHANLRSAPPYKKWKLSSWKNSNTLPAAKSKNSQKRRKRHAFLPSRVPVETGKIFTKQHQIFFEFYS